MSPRPRRAAPGAPPPSADPRSWRVVRAVAAHGLSHAPAIPDFPTDSLSWTRIVGLATQQRVLGLLVAAVMDGTLDLEARGLGAEAWMELAQAHEGWCAHDLRLERVLIQAAGALDRADIAYRVTKGPVLAHRAYPDAGQRVFADLDLIVPSGQVRAATAALSTALDAEPAFAELRPGFDEEFGKETLLRTRPTTDAPAGLEVDLHRTPVAGALGLAIDLDELFDRPGLVWVAGRALPTPGPVPTVLLAAYQATVADVPPRLGAWRDLVQLLETPAGTGGDAPGATEVVSVAAHWRARLVLARAVGDAWAGLGLARPEPGTTLAADLMAWADSYAPRWSERIVLDAHRRPGYVYWRQLAGVAMITGWGARRRYLAALAWPQAGYLADRRWSFGRHAARAARTLGAPVRNQLVSIARRIGRRLAPRS